MKRILIIGLSPILGGVETYIYNFIKYSNKEKYYFDFLIIDNKKSVYENEINKVLNDNKHFFYCPNLKKNYFLGIKWLMKFYKENKYDIIYMNTCTAAKIQYCLLGLLNSKAKLITHSHNGNGASKFNNFIFRSVVNFFSKVKLACSDVAAKWLFGNNIRAKIIPNGIDTERFKFNLDNRKNIRSTFKIKENEIVIGHVGRFFEQKNHYYFLRLISKLPNNYKIILIGEGKLKENFIKEIKKENLEKRFIILPVKEDIEKYYSAMDLFVMPSFYEGLPIVAVEAQANGLSCVFSNNVSKQSDLSNHCYFLSLNDIDLWIDTIIRMDLKRYDGKKEIIEHKFNIENTVKSIEKIFDEI